MAELAAPKNPEDLWLATGLFDVPAHRMLMQGDVVVTPDGPVCVVSHACSMRQGPDIHPTQIVAPIRDCNCRWKGDYDWMPLPCAEVPGMENPAACIRELRSESTEVLNASERIAELGQDTDREFHRFLDGDDRKLRDWLSETHSRPQAMRDVRQEIRRRKEN